jgi:hypothetical protein
MPAENKKASHKARLLLDLPHFVAALTFASRLGFLSIKTFPWKLLLQENGGSCLT